MNFTKIYNKYKGLWITLDKSLKTVISAESSAKKAYESALKKGYQKPVLFKVPAQNLPYIGTFLHD